MDAPSRRHQQGLDALLHDQLHDEAAKAFEAQRFDEALALYERLEQVGMLRPEERERLKVVRRTLSQDPEDESGQWFLSRHQRDRDDEDDRRRKPPRRPRS